MIEKNELELALERLTVIFGRQAPSMDAKNQWNKAMFSLIQIINRKEEPKDGAEGKV